MRFSPVLPCSIAFGLLLAPVHAKLLISEVVPHGEHELKDEDGDTSDWIELYNSGSKEIALGDFALTDNASEPVQWKLPKRELGPGEFLVVFASGKDRADEGELHTNFKLSAKGEYLAIVGVKNQKPTYAFEFPKVPKQQSYGYRFDGKTINTDRMVYFKIPTPGGANGVAALPKVADTKFSVDRGFFDEPFELEITTKTEGASIRYTTDGSLPSAENGKTYEGPLKVGTTTVLRVMALKKNHVSTNVDTSSYIFPEAVTKQPAQPEGWPTHYEITGRGRGFGRFGTTKRDEKGLPVDYEMSAPEKVGAPREEIVAALRAIPSLSIVTDQKHFFDKETGIFMHPGRRGKESERPTSIELIDPQGREDGFQVDAGLRIRGGHSRSISCQKHSFRVYFRKEYGPGELNYPLFGEEGVDSFDDIDLRTSQNYSYHYNDDPRQNTFVRDVFLRDSQAALGQPYARSRYYHLYLNGLYWGLYQTQEHAEASYGVHYFGGEEEDYDAIKSKPSSDGRTTDGNDKGWRELWELAGKMAGEEDEAAQQVIYRQLQGLGPDGKPDEDLPVYLDIANLIDYMLVIFLTGSFDGPVTNFAGNFASNNWFGIWNRNGRDGFKFFCHDAEHSLGSHPGMTEANRVGPFYAGAQYGQSNPQWIHQQLTAVPEYRDRFRARAEETLLGEGLLSESSNLIRLQYRVQEVGKVIVAECARWGDTRVEEGIRKADWERAIARLEEVLNVRAKLVPEQLAQARRYPKGVPARETLEAPLFNPVLVPSFRQRTELTGTFEGEKEESVVYYTVNGQDPRGEDGKPVASASKAKVDRQEYPVILENDSEVRAFVPQDDSLGLRWIAPDFDDSDWLAGKGGIGYDQADTYEDMLGLDLEEQMFGKRSTVYARYAFTVGELPRYQKIYLYLQAEDGLVAYLNGKEVGRMNLRGEPGFEVLALGNPDQRALHGHTMDLTEHAALLKKGRNVLAIQLVNERLESSDLLLVPELILERDIPGTVVTLDQSSQLVARTFENGQWSPIFRAQSGPPSARPARKGELVLSEIMYHPTSPSEKEVSAGVEEGSDLEFLEFTNRSSKAIEASGIYSRGGIYFVVRSRQILAPGETMVLARNPRSFSVRYPGVRVAGSFQGKLANSSELLTIFGATGEELCRVEYSDEQPWPAKADGAGYSLVRKSGVESDGNDPASWTASEKKGGSPGRP